jgi:hypothetical protein
MGVRVCAGVRIGRARRIPRQAAALVGILAILFQATLSAWHHHAPPFHARVASSVTTLTAPSSQGMPESADHDCQICCTLNHHGAVPVDFLAAKSPDGAPLHQIRVAVAAAPLLIPYLLFRSRAPPVA